MADQNPGPDDLSPATPPPAPTPAPPPAPTPPPPPPAPTAPPPPAPTPPDDDDDDESNRKRYILIALLLLLLLLCLGGVLFYLFGRDDGETDVDPTPTPTTTTQGPTPGPSTPGPDPSGSGTIVDEATIPDFTGKTAGEAEDILRDAGFKDVSIVGPDPTTPVSTLEDWPVTRTDPPAGTKAKLDQKITIYVTPPASPARG